MNFYKLIDRWHSLVGRKSLTEELTRLSPKTTSPTAVAAALKLLNAHDHKQHGESKHAALGKHELPWSPRLGSGFARTDFMGLRPLK